MECMALVNFSHVERNGLGLDLAYSQTKRMLSWQRSHNLLVLHAGPVQIPFA